MSLLAPPSARRIVLLASTFLLFTFTASAHAEVVAPATAAESTVRVAPAVPAAPAQDVQVADEIIRRLRRLGLNFNRIRIQRPYDPEGELC